MPRAPWTCHSCTRTLRARCGFPIPKFVRFVSIESKLAPGLLARAKVMKTEHDELKKKLQQSFDAATAKRAGELQRVVSALQEWETATSAIAELRSMAAEADGAGQGDVDLAAIAHDELVTETARLEGLERNLCVSLTPRHPFADLPCLLEIRPGPGGLEGRYFADSLFKMYKRLCERRGYRVNVIKYDMSDSAGDASSSISEAPLQEAVLEIQDAGAYDLFRSEAGMHRVQRVPSTELKGRTHTSAVAVWVLPSTTTMGDEDSGSGGGGGVRVDDPESLFYIDPKEVKVEKTRARGAGGQHVNKTESAIRMTHLPTGTTVSMQDHRSQHMNRVAAWKLMRARLAAQRAEHREQEAARLRDSVLSTAQITCGDKIRTYNFGQDRCTDHRVGLDVHNLPNVLEGGQVLDKIMDAARNWLIGLEITALVAEDEAKAKATLTAK